LVVPHDFQNLRGLTFGQRLLLLLEIQNDAGASASSCRPPTISLLIAACSACALR
jgi:hypothetical protein